MSQPIGSSFNSQIAVKMPVDIIDDLHFVDIRKKKNDVIAYTFLFLNKTV